MTDTEETMTPAETIDALSPEEVWERYVGDQSRAEFAENTQRRIGDVRDYAVWAVSTWHEDALPGQRRDAVPVLVGQLCAHLAADGIEVY